MAVPARANAPISKGDTLSREDTFLQAPNLPLQRFELSKGNLPYVPTMPRNTDEIQAYIKGLWKEEAEEAIAVFTCESGLRPDAINWGDAKITGKPSMGIAQLNRPYDEKYFDWKYNLDTAYREFYLTRGWQPWTCATKLGIR